MNKFKIIGIIATGLGMGLTLLADWASEKQQEQDTEELIDKKLNERFATSD